MRGVGKTTPYLDPKLLASPFGESEGSYTLCWRIASGGMATVYLAMYRGTDGLQRPVAVKLIHPHLAKHAEFVEMFFDEAQLAACLEHPGVCALYDFGRTHDSYFLAMEYLIGETFDRVASVLQGRSHATTMMRTPFFIARMIADVAEALHAVHEARDEEGRPLEIVHRDVTPHNLFVLYDGSIRVTDFGIARSRDRVHHTQSGVLKGKIGYMAPEQLGQEPVDRRSDVWSVGVVLWELLANERLFYAPSVAATVDAAQHRVVRPPSQANPFVPTGLDAIALRALERDKAKRYQTMRELALDLETFLSVRKDTVPAADVTEWLDGLFPGEAARRREMVARTRAMVPTSMPPAPLAPSARVTPQLDDQSSDITIPRLPRSGARKSLAQRGAVRAVGSAFVLLIGVVALYLALQQARPNLARSAGSNTPAATVPTLTVPPVSVPAVASSPASAPKPEEIEATQEVDTSVTENARTPRASRATQRVQRRPHVAHPSPSPSEPQAPTAVARGQVFVSSTAPAEVYYRGKLLGRAPLGVSLPVGAQSLELKPASGGPSVSVSVDVKHGAVTMTRVTMAAADSP